MSLPTTPVARLSAETGATALRGEPDPDPASYMGDAWVIVELAPDGILVVDDHGRILLANRAAETMFGYSRGDLTTLGVETLVPEGRRHGHRNRRIDYNASPRTRPMGLGLDLWARRADGSEFPVEISLSQATLGGGSSVVVIVREVAAHRASEHAARERTLLDYEERTSFTLLHRVIAHLSAAGTQIQSVLERVDETIAPPLVDAIEEVNTAIEEIRSTVIHQDSNVAGDN